ncbi:hypothetical protein Vadar_027806 [Vaccinium darrowii]|uniref:Uncharacterized protein n=1 Tax=Vaccinium darrowii TaxID=229202 RepID=A0ACB7ZNF6_9ERIC|nr:hypothetical protein Vadar_027806 [Vaccinium darrowii]
MDSRELAAFISSLTSQLLLTLLLFPSSIPLPTTNSNSHGNLFPLLLHFLSTSDLAASLSLFPLSRKRKRTDDRPNPQLTPLARADSSPNPEHGQLSQVDSIIPRNPDSFKLCYRMSSSTFEWLASLLEPLLECRDPVDSPLNLPAETRLGIGLFRLSTGADYPDISTRFRVSYPVAKFCVKQFCRVLCTNFRFWVGFPSPSELVDVSSGFESSIGIPNCCGVVGCTRFRIARRNGDEPLKTEEVGGPSIAAQIVVDSSSRILSIVAGFDGNNSDWTILKSSSLYKDIESGSLLNSPPIYINSVSVPQYLVGDRTYPLLPWLITPFPNPESGKHEEKFNAALNLVRLPAVRTIASLKNWGVLNKPIEAELKTAVAYIVDDQAYRDTNLEDNSVELKGSVIRTALATRAEVIHGARNRCLNTVRHPDTSQTERFSALLRLQGDQVLSPLSLNPDQQFSLPHAEPIEELLSPLSLGCLAFTPNLQFTYVLLGGEGSIADGRVLRDAINRGHGLVVPHGYTNGEGFLAPDGEDTDIVSSVETSPQWTSFRDNKATSMFIAWRASRRARR